VQVLFSQTGLATQILVSTGDQGLLLDCGDGVVRDLLQVGTPLNTLSGVFLTHGHADHLGGLWGLLGYLRAEGRNSPFGVWYPHGSKEVEKLLSAFGDAHLGSLPYVLSAQPLGPGEVVRLGEMTVRAWEVNHRDSVAGVPLGPAPALGYLLKAGDEKVAYTGDTGSCPGLFELVRGVDLALIEATWEEPGPEGLHLTRSEAEALAQLAQSALFIHRRDGRVLAQGDLRRFG